MKNKKSIEIEYIDMIVKLSELYKAKGETIESVTYKEGAKEFKFKNSILEFNAFFSNISHFRTTSESKIDNEKVYITKNGIEILILTLVQLNMKFITKK
jgi:hypothetical protein